MPSICEHVLVGCILCSEKYSHAYYCNLTKKYVLLLSSSENKTKYAQCAISGFILRVQAVQFNKALFSSMILLSFAVGHLLPTAVPLWQQEWSCLELHAKLHSAFPERLLAALEQNPQHVLHRWPCQWQGAGTLHA